VEQLQSQFHVLIQGQAIQNTFISQQHTSITTQLTSLSQMIKDLMILKSSMCPHVCSGNGHCLTNECVCDENYEGQDCSRPLGTSSIKEALSPSNNVVAKSTNRTTNLFAFDFGRSTHTFIASDEILCGPMQQATVSLWLQPRGGGGATLISYATPSRDSELLLWLDESCLNLYMWINSVSRHDLEGVPVGNFTNLPLCDGHWHHLVVTWDGILGESRTFLDGRFWEMHWSVFYQETLKSSGRIVLGHNQVHLEPRSKAVVPDAFLGVMSDFYFIANATVDDSQARMLFTSDLYKGPSPFIHWSLNSTATAAADTPNAITTTPDVRLTDLGTLSVGANVFGGSWVAAGNRVCNDLSSV